MSFLGTPNAANITTGSEILNKKVALTRLGFDSNLLLARPLPSARPEQKMDS